MPIDEIGVLLRVATVPAPDWAWAQEKPACALLAIGMLALLPASPHAAARCVPVFVALLARMLWSSFLSTHVAAFCPRCRRRVWQPHLRRQAGVQP